MPEPSKHLTAEVSMTTLVGVLAMIGVLLFLYIFFIEQQPSKSAFSISSIFRGSQLSPQKKLNILDGLRAESATNEMSAEQKVQVLQGLTPRSEWPVFVSDEQKLNILQSIQQ